jgi:hypothetical protein
MKYINKEPDTSSKPSCAIKLSTTIELFNASKSLFIQLFTPISKRPIHSQQWLLSKSATTSSSASMS